MTFCLDFLSPSFDWKNQFVKTKCDERNDNEAITDTLEENVNLICGNLQFLNRKSKQITYKSLEGKVFHSEYDILILCNSLEEKSYS